MKDTQTGDDLKQSIQRSRDNRAALMARFGFIPLSIIRLGRGAFSKSLFQYQSEEPNRRVAAGAKNREKQMRLAKVGYAQFKNNPSQRMIGRGHSPASIMPAELVEFFVQYYAQPGQVYLDPFMGQGVQMQVACAYGLHYWGYDLSREFFDYIQAVRSKIDTRDLTVNIYCADSMQPDHIPDNIGDFSFHSPPYWDIEYYGDDPAQLGTGHTYHDFLQGMERVARAWLPKFKSGAWHVVNVNDFRKDATFYSYHSDTIDLFKRAGWVHHDTWIIDGLVGGLSKAFAVDFNLKRIAPKTHEYALVFRKP